MTSKVDAILAKQKELAAELEKAMQEERAVVLADIKAKIKMFDFNATDFKGMFKTRTTQKQVDDFLAKQKKAEAKKEAKAKPKGPAPVQQQAQTAQVQQLTPRQPLQQRPTNSIKPVSTTQNMSTTNMPNAASQITTATIKK